MTFGMFFLLYKSVSSNVNVYARSAISSCCPVKIERLTSGMPTDLTNFRKWLILSVCLYRCLLSYNISSCFFASTGYSPSRST